MNIIIPLGELGNKFQHEGYTRPKPLVSVLGKEMIYYIFDNIHLGVNDTIYVIYKTEMNKWNFKDIMAHKYPYVKLIPINYQTKGVAETLLYGLDKIDFIDNETITMDCDNFYTIDVISMYKEYKEYKEQSNVIF